MQSLKLTILFFFSMASMLMSGQLYYPVQNFAPDEYGGESQNWDISQSSDKMIFIANNKGLLEYNGANWRLYDSPNHTILRSVSVHDERIYTGCYMEFGFWERDEFSNLKYTSLSEKVEDDLLEDEQFWKILCFDQYVLFQSLHRIYIYNKQAQNFQYVTSVPNLPKMFMVENRVMFQKLDEGLYELENGQATLISDFPEFRKDIIVNIFALQNKLLIQTQDNGFYILESNRISKWQIEDSEIINSLSVYCSLQLNDGTYVLGTISEGLYFLSSEGKITMHIDKKSGLLNNTILSLHEDLDNNIWLGLDNGIGVINYDSPYRVYNDTKGVFGAVYASASYEGKLYLGTNQGLFYGSINATEDFKNVNGTKGQVWSLRIIDNTLFCGHNRGTFIVKDSSANQISDVMGTWDIKSLPQHKNFLLQGNYEGLHILEKRNGNWQYRNKIEGFNISSRFFEFISDNKVMVSHEYRGVYNLELSPDYMKVNKTGMEKVAALSINSSLTKYKGKLYYFSESGVFEFDQEQEHFRKSTLLNQLIFEGEEFISGKLINDENHFLWAFTQDHIILLQPGKVDKSPQVVKIPLPFSIRENIAGYENLLNLGNSNYLLGTANGYIIFNPDKITDPETSIVINTVEKNKLNQKKVYISPEAKNHLLKATEKNLHFSYSVPFYEKFRPVSYQYKLEGIHNNWSDWTKESMVSFMNLPSGDYTFKVRAIVGTKLTKNSAAFDFTIAKAWYVSDWMKIIYLFLFSGILYSTGIIYKRRYNQQKKKIMLEKKNELAMLQLENEKERIRLRNENLNIEVEAISKELASSYMAIVAKNDLLNSIKNNLNPEKDNKSVSASIKIIDDNLENNTDWKSFQEAFDNTDRDFLRKIKELHPSVTPNDLKLCVYLRLNLSSKEIAPLLNISAQSVEIKRFRLRKKMKLSHGQNLTEYILSL